MKISGQCAVLAKTARLTVILTVLASTAGVACGATIVSLQGSLSNAEDTFVTTFVLASPSAVTVQTWGFGGGTNAEGTVIPAGGFDPFIGIFAGTGPSALIETSGPITYGTSDVLATYASFSGCPPAGLVTIGSTTGNCGDITMSLALAAGTYTVLLSDAAFIPDAAFDNGTLGEGFIDFTGGTLPFQTCVDSSDCITDTANWAFDITTPGGPAAPEPSTFLVAGIGLLVLGRFRRRPFCKTTQNQQKGASQ